MTVKELIKILETFNQKAEVVDFEGDKITPEQVCEGVIGGKKNPREVVYISTCPW